ncbi:MAG TPA: GNAT family N-acetyltransferase [Thermoanaerobaculia bacterium]|nr:GNAT family N-acetyltransferase [Thermoanaerobaculia bacterium]
MPLALLEVTAGRNLEAFLGLPAGDTLASLFRPEFEGRQRAWVAVVGDKPRARIVARRSPVLKDLGMLGFFEALPGSEEEVARLFEASIHWLRETGAGEIVGPMDGDTWHKHRLNVGPWDDPPFLMEPWNPPYYPELWESNGFEVLERYLSKRVESGLVADFLEPKRQAALAAGYRLRRMEPAKFVDELRTIYRISVRIFARNFLYTEISEQEFFALYAGARGLLDPDFVWFAQSPEGEDVGFLFAFPDGFQGKTDAVNMKTIGVLPEHRRAGLGAALMGQAHRIAQEKGYRFANHCLFREGNPSGEMDGGTGRVMRNYHLYRLA